MEVVITPRPGSLLVPAGKCTLCGYPVAAEYDGTEYVLPSPEGKELAVCGMCVESIRVSMDRIRSRMLRYVEKLEAQARSLRRGLKYTFVVKEET
jgi:hypothetical protein